MSHPIPDALLRDQYLRTRLADAGISYEQALRDDALRISLEAAVRGRRRLAAKQARESALPHQVQESKP